MSLSLTHLPTHWVAGEAYTVIAFLDLLRDQLWETYDDDITEMLQDASTPPHDARQTTLKFDNEPPF
jgi:hypothetical protein